jgi:hypothetical protein
MPVAAALGNGAARYSDYRPFVIGEKPFDDIPTDYSERPHHDCLVAHLHASFRLPSANVDPLSCGRFNEPFMLMSR